MIQAKEIFDQFLAAVREFGPNNLQEIEFLLPENMVFLLRGEEYLREKYQPKSWYFLSRFSSPVQRTTGYYFLPRRLGKSEWKKS